MNLIVSHGQVQQDRQSDLKEYRRLMFIAVVLFFVFVAVTRLLPRSWRPTAPQAGQRESLYQEARRMACTCIPYAFMN